MSQALLAPKRRQIGSPKALRPSLWLRPDSGVYTGGSRTLTAADKSAFVGTSKNTTRIAGVDFWLSVWVNLSSFSNYPVLFTDILGTANRGISVYIDNAGKPSIDMYHGSATYTSVYSTTAISLNAWAHVMFTADRNGNGVWYINGVAVKTQDISAANGVDFSTPAGASYPAIGNNVQNASINSVSGSIAMIGYGEGYVPTAADVLALYNSGNGLTYAEVEARGGALATSLISNASRTGFYYNCNEQDPTSGLTDQAGSLDLVRTPAELLTNTGFETRTGITGASFAAPDKAHLEIADNPVLDLGTGDFVINANVLRTSAGTIQVIASKFQSLTDYWALYIDASNYVCFYAIASSSANVIFTASTTALTSTTTKYHIQVAADRGDINNCKIYVNGTLQTLSGSSINATSIDNTGKLFVGQLGNGTLYFDGRISMLGIGKPTITDAASLTAVTDALGRVAGTAGLGQYYGEQSSADKTALAWSAFWDLTEASGNRVDKVSSLTLAEALTTNLVANGTFTEADGTSPPTGWTNNATYPWDTFDVLSNAARVICNGDGAPTVCVGHQTLGLTSGRNYLISYAATRTSGDLEVAYTATATTGSTGGYLVTHSSNATVTNSAFTASATSGVIRFKAVNTAASSWTVDNVTVTAASIPCASDADVFGGWTDGFAGNGQLSCETMTPETGAISCRCNINSSGNETYVRQAILTAGNPYVYSVRAKRVSSGRLQVYMGSTATTTQTLTDSYATYSVTGTAAGTANFTLYFDDNNGVVVVDTVSCKSAAIAVGNGPAEALATNSGSGTGLDGTFVGVSASGLVTNWKSDVPAALAGAGGYSFLFDGSDDYLSVPATTGNNIASGTICAWVKCVSTSTGMIFVRQHDGVGTYAAFSIGRYIASDGSWTAGDAGKIYWHGKNGVAQAASTGTITAATWAHAAVVFSATSATMYINATASGTTNGDYSIPNDAVCVASIAARYTSGAAQGFFSGQLDDVRIYSTALSAAQIAQLYAGQEATGATPVGWWKFDDGPWGVPSDGDPVWMVESQDGFRYQLSQTTAGNRPVQRVSAINSKPAFEFDGASDYLRVASVVPFAAAATIACVVQPDDVILGTPATQCIIAVQDEGSANNFIWLGISTDGKATIQGNNAATAFTVTGNTVLSDATAYIIIAQWDGTNWQLSVNGTAQTETRTGTEVAPASISGMDSITLGARYSSATASAWYDGLLAEPVVDLAYSLAEITMLLHQWKKRYAIT